MDRFEAMKLLVAAIDAGSLTAAGRLADIPLPTISRKISDLEMLIGSRLLIRTTRRLSLTDAGVAYVAAARRILEQLEVAEREAAGEFIAPKGELVLTAPIMFGRLHVLPIVNAFLGEFSEINIRLLLSDSNAHLVDDHVDMAVRIGTLADSGMIATQVGAMRTVICASPRLLEAYGRPECPADLQNLPTVRLDAPMPFQHSKHGVAESTRRMPPRLSVTTADAAAQAAIDGVGVVQLLHYQVAEAISEGLLEIVLDNYEPPSAPINLIHMSPGHMPLKMRRFLDFAIPRFRQRLDQ
ncbi:LysR family transcriptional regulator [Pseudomonas sp. 52 E 6]|uniref:LysR family transcriptional regulator n=1 Tax=Pseudomonas sp. 52 E 6 TaxID=1844106 RepID=UPI000812B36C|nr:LysR family transcriptional regulator [Pseudomonas sp. 52 E 6]CRM30774.1 D-malate degradation protein R [Pseudomonas sp. 52 E 6]